jgi:hypothetical protein
MFKNGIKRDSQMDQIMSIFNSNIPRKINFNSFINNNPTNFNNNYYDDFQKKPREISKFNPYDYENDNKYFDNYYECRSKTNVNNENNKENNNLDNNFYHYYDCSEENIHDNHDKSDLFIKKISNYINDINEEDLNNNIIKNYEFKNNFSSPKLKRGKYNETHISQCSIKKQKKKQVCFTDLKDEPNNIKIRSTNYTSNLSFDNNNNNIYKKESDIYNINPLDENNINLIKKNTKIKKKNKKIDNATFVNKNHKNKRNVHSNLINHRNKGRIIDKKQKKNIPVVRSTIQHSKTLKTIDEYMEIKRNKSKSKNSHVKKGNNSHEKRKNMSNIKVNANELKPKEKNKSKNRLISINKKDDNNDDTQAIKTSKNNNNEDKKIISKKKEKIKSIPKVKSSHCFFKSFLCCFGYNNCINSNGNNDKLIKSNTHKIKTIKTDINNNINDKKPKNKSSKKKKKKINNE